MLGRLTVKKWLRFAGVGLVCLAGGCAIQSGLVKISPAASYEPTRDKALIVFLRPSVYGGGVQASVYDITDNSDVFIGILSGKTKVAHLTGPGEKLFMVIGENADFMKATLEAGKTYYALVSPRVGVWKARFSLLPIHKDTTSKYRTESDEFREWLNTTQYIENTDASIAWYQMNKARVQARKFEYLQKWDRMLPQDKEVLTLHANDGK